VTKSKKPKEVKAPDIQADISSDKLKSTNKLHPAFCFRYNTVCRYKVEDLDDKDKIALVSTLYKLGRVDWNTVNSSWRHGIGMEKIDKKACRFSVPKNLPRELEFLTAFGFSGYKSMLGFRDGKVWHIVAVDGIGDAYEHE